jgi:hypothetical protein
MEGLLTVSNRLLQEWGYNPSIHNFFNPQSFDPQGINNASNTGGTRQHILKHDGSGLADLNAARFTLWR